MLLKHIALVSLTKKISDDQTLAIAKHACASVTNEPAVSVMPVIYPNPSTGIFKFQQKGAAFNANQVFIMNAQGKIVAVFSNVTQFNISNLPAGMYWYKLVIDKKEFSGKVVRL